MRRTWIAGLVWLCGVMPLRAVPLRVACIGDSITFGAFLPNRDVASYPARLQALSDGRLATTNLGASGHTLIKAGKLSWWNSPALAQAVEFQPEAVVIMLGTCDVVEPDKLAGYETDLHALVDYFSALPSAPRLWLATPPPIPTRRQWKLNWRLNHRVIPAIRRVAQARGIPVIDVNAALRGRADLFPDHLHPDTEGASIIAHAVWDALRPLVAAPP